MTEKEAKSILEEVKEFDDSMYQYNEKYLQALDVAIKLLGQELCEDTISREAMLNLQAKYADQMGATKFWQMRDDIRALPPVKSIHKKGHWAFENKAKIVISQLREDRDRLQNIINQIKIKIEDTGAYEQEVHGKTEFLEGINYCLSIINKCETEMKGEE